MAALVGFSLLAAAGALAESASPPLGIALEESAYPFPVKFLALVVEGQDVRMAYMDVAPSAAANGRTVVLLHGKNFGGSYWEGTIRALGAAGYRVVVPDQLGFGKSGKPAIRYGFDLLAANTAALLDALGVGRAAIVGHSMGGMLAVRFARTYPGRSSHLVLANPIGLEDYRLSIPPVPLERLYRDELANTDPEKIRAFYRKYVVKWEPALEGPVAERVRVTMSGEYPRWAMSSALTYQMIYEQPMRGELPFLSVPTLLVIGQSDRTVVGAQYAPEPVRARLGQYPELGRAAARDIPGAKLVELREVAHIPHLEAPDAFHRALLEFLHGPAGP